MDMNFMECPITFKPCNYSGNCNKCPLVLDEVEEALKPVEIEDNDDLNIIDFENLFEEKK